jgi:hypothetical protein
MSDQATRLHESAHAAAAVFLGGRRVDCVRVDWPEPNIPGRMTSTLERDLGPEDLVVSLVGWMVDPDDRPNWPPRWPVDADEADAVGKLVRALGLNQEAYGKLIELAEEVVADPHFRRLMGLISRALAAAPVIHTESVAILARAAGFPDPAEEAS